MISERNRETLDIILMWAFMIAKIMVFITAGVAVILLIFAVTVE